MQRDSFFERVMEYGTNERLDRIIIKDEKYQKLHKTRTELMKRQQAILQQKGKDIPVELIEVLKNLDDIDGLLMDFHTQKAYKQGMLDCADILYELFLQGDKETEFQEP